VTIIFNRYLTIVYRHKPFFRIQSSFSAYHV